MYVDDNNTAERESLMMKEENWLSHISDEVRKDDIQWRKGGGEWKKNMSN